MATATASLPTLIQLFISMTVRVVKGYFEQTLESRQPGGTGSTFDEPVSREDIEALDWGLAECPAVEEGCFAFRAVGISGSLGVVHADDAPENRRYRFEDPKNTGFASCVLIFEEDADDAELRHKTNDVWMIVGQEQGEWVVFTFHPGEPIPNSQIPISAVRSEWSDKQKDWYDLDEVKKFGVQWIKIEG